MIAVDRHNEEIQRNFDLWRRKPSLRKAYRNFHETIAAALPASRTGIIAELGSGVPNISEVIPGCLRTDLFPNPWLDQVENAYALSFPDGSVSALVLFDVFHHLRYPGTALAEFRRALMPGGRVIVFDPCVSLLGRLVYGALHAEPLGLGQHIEPSAPAGWSPAGVDYYAAQGNATRVFLGNELEVAEMGWRVVTTRRMSAISYVLSGGYSRPQMYPDWAYPLLRRVDRIADAFPRLCATRLLVALEKTGGG